METIAQTLPLLPHPDTPCRALDEILVELSIRRPGLLRLRYVLKGQTGRLRIPPVSPAERTDGLWAHTCFELFIAPGPDGGYLEYNFAPSTRWAAYAFDGYRNGMRDLAVRAPAISIAQIAGQFAVSVEVGIPPIPDGGAVRIGLSAVIEEEDGAKSYWALRHPPGRPDFHHSDCFALSLPAPLAP